MNFIRLENDHLGNPEYIIELVSKDVPPEIHEAGNIYYCYEQYVYVTLLRDNIMLKAECLEKILGKLEELNGGKNG